ncbi:Hypothetical predicted protein [Pelobates cultripes]|uniref:Uncharacterized protein n=1 Tax=Pelobates cultripes TaxID=61616 RepID=A0AAD1RP97_PELCU|nr:Hypothetical predicted protein [Pelobates cultripes]
MASQTKVLDCQDPAEPPCHQLRITRTVRGQHWRPKLALPQSIPAVKPHHCVLARRSRGGPTYKCGPCHQSIPAPQSLLNTSGLSRGLIPGLTVAGFLEERCKITSMFGAGGVPLHGSVDSTISEYVLVLIKH